MEIKKQKTTQEWLAFKAGISPTVLRSAVSRGNEPSASRALAIACALGVSVEYLVTGEKRHTWRPPKELLPIVDALMLLNQDALVEAEHYVLYLVRRSREGKQVSGTG